jgi:hypothetical protein
MQKVRGVFAALFAYEINQQSAPEATRDAIFISIDLAGTDSDKEPPILESPFSIVGVSQAFFVTTKVTPILSYPRITTIFLKHGTSAGELKKASVSVKFTTSRFQIESN